MGRITDEDKDPAKHTPDEPAADTAADAPPAAVDWVARLRELLVTADGLGDLPDPEPLIGTDLVFRDTLNWVVGRPGCMKSFVMLDMAGCVATGEPWQTYPVVQGNVLFLVAEGVRGTKRRVQAWVKAMGRPMDNVWFLPIAVQSTNATQWDAFIEVSRELNPVMIVIDTQARVTVGVEENSNKEMGAFVDQVERLRRASAAAVFIVHHIGRNGETGRGATVLDGALSTIIRVTKDEDRIRLECLKNKDGAEWDEIELRAVPMAESVVLMPTDGAYRDRAAGGPSAAAMKMARTWWDAHGDKWAPTSQLVDIVAPKTTFFRNRRELEASGLVIANREPRYPTYRLTADPSERHA